jgi:hypothetical protein
MKSSTHYLKIHLPQERGFRNITDEVEERARSTPTPT